MTHRLHPIAVKPLPQSPTQRQEHHFLLSLHGALSVDRPRIVLDCSTIQHMDRPTLQLLLCCLEEAMKRNGDVKLAGLAQAPLAVLEKTGVEHLFEFYATIEDAVHSFRRAPSVAVHAVATATEPHPSETAT